MSDAPPPSDPASMLTDQHEASPLIGTAVHASHRLSPSVAPIVEVAEAIRFLEEDPFTHRFLRRVPHWVVPNQSRFEVDTNRPPDRAIYAKPGWAWGIQVFKSEGLTAEIREQILERWYAFHTEIDRSVQAAIERFGRAVVLDFHSFNYQREGPTDWKTDGKPVFNLGTKPLRLDDDGKELVSWFMDDVRTHRVHGEPMTVAENVVFGGGYLNRRLSRRFGPKCITLSIEYKKVFMDETTGELHEPVLASLVDQMDGTLAKLATRLDATLRPDEATPGV